LDFYEVLTSRSSVRAFSGEEVDEAAVIKLLESACRAPTAGNLQPWRFYVVRDAAVRRSLARAAHGQSQVEAAPVVIVVCAELAASARGYGRRGEELYAIQDTAAAVENILLSAVAEGLGACWVGAFDEGAAGAALGLQTGTRPLAMVPVGHPAGPTRKTPREPLENVTEFI
jgi:nitroreductase